MAEFFPIQIKDLAFPSAVGESSIKGLPPMAIGERESRNWLRDGLLSGWAMLSGGIWGFCSGIVERAQVIHKQLGAREPPGAIVLPGHMGVLEFTERFELRPSVAYSVLNQHAEQLEAFKYKGQWQIPETLTSDAVVVVLGLPKR